MKRILVICSWLEIDGPKGSFFLEQAAMLQNDFEMHVSTFKAILIGRRKFFAFWNWFKIEEHTFNSSVRVYFVYYPMFTFLPDILSPLFKSFAENRLLAKLNINNQLPDLVHAQSIFNAGLHAESINRRTGIPVIFTEHSQFSLRSKTKSELRALDRLIKTSKRKLVVSFDKIRQFAANGIFSNFDVVGNGVNDEIFNYETKSKDKKRFDIITIGAFNPIKDHNTMLAALKLLDEMLVDEDVKFTWIGYEGWHSKSDIRVHEFVKNFHISKIKIDLLPTLSREQISKKLKGSDLFLFTSISEGMPVSILEALCCGVPVYTTNCGGVDEIVNSLNGKIFQLHDANAIASSIYDMINGKVTYNSSSISIGAINSYGKKVFTDKMKAIYNQSFL